MKNRSQIPALILLVCLVLGCHKKVEVNSSVTDLEKSLAAAAPAPVQAQVNPQATAAQREANALLQNAVTAAKANDYARSVIALQAATQKSGLTADQVMAAQRAKQAMTYDLQRRAVSGDQQAIAALKAIERASSQ